MDTKKSKDSAVFSLLKFACMIHNLVQFGGWAYQLYLILSVFAQEKRIVYDVLKYPGVLDFLITIQLLQWFDLVFAILKVTRTNILFWILQILGRTVVVSVIYPCHKETIYGFISPIPWAFAEMVRYSCYISLNVSFLEALRPLLKWVRLTAFIGLYPWGLTGELLAMYDAWSYVEKKRPFTIEMPNSLNFAFDIMIGMWMFAIITPIGFVMIYRGLLSKFFNSLQLL